MAISVKALSASGYQNECKVHTALLKAFCAAGAQEIGKLTSPVTFVYSACGCPVKAMVRRVGDRTVRAKDLPVLFPDDPQAVAVISHLMRWQ